MKLLPAVAVALALAARVAADPDPAPPAERKETAASPADCWKQFLAALGRTDKDRVWELFGKDSREILLDIGRAYKKMEGRDRTEAAAEVGVTVEEFDKLSERDLVLAHLFATSRKDSLNDTLKMTITDIVVDGDRAEGKRHESEDKVSTAYFLKEDGEWKLDVKRELDEEKAEADKK